MTTEKKKTKKEIEALIVAAGRKHLRTWLLAAKKHGTIYYTCEASRSGMYRTIKLATIKRNAKGKVELVTLWPGPYDLEAGHGLDVVAKDWGFSFKKRAFEAHGAGMDMVFATVYKLALKTGLSLETANSIRREAF